MTLMTSVKKPLVGETNINPENILIEYVISNGVLTYDLIDLITRTKEIVGSHASGKDKQRNMVNVFDDFRYNNDTETKREVDAEFLRIKYDDLLKDLVDIYNFSKKKKSRLSVKYSKELKNYSLRISHIVGIELGELFADLRYRRNEQAKFDIISKVLSLTWKDRKNSTVSRKKQSAYEFISTLISHEAMKKNLIYNYYFNQKIPLEGDYIFRGDYEIIDRMVEREEDVFLVYLVFANLEKLKEKDLGLLNRLARYLEYSPSRIVDGARKLLNDIQKATNYTYIQEIDVMALVRREAKKMAQKDKVDTYGESDINKYLKKMKKSKPKIYEKLLKEYVITYDPHRDTIASFFEKMKESYAYIKREDSHYGPRYTTYPYLEKMKIEDDWFLPPKMLVPDDSKRKMVINQIVDYYEKKYEIDREEALEYLKEDLEKHKPDKTSRHVLYQMEKYPKLYQTFIEKLNKDITYLDSQIRSMAMFKPGAIGYIRTGKEFGKRQKGEKVSPRKASPRKASPRKASPKKCPKGKVLNPEGTRCINEGGVAHLHHLEEDHYNEATTKKYSYLLIKKTPKKRERPKSSTKTSPKRKTSPKLSPKRKTHKKCPQGKVLNPQGSRCINLGGAAHIKHLKEGKYNEVTTTKYAHLLIKKKTGRPKGSGKK